MDETRETPTPGPTRASQLALVAEAIAAGTLMALVAVYAMQQMGDIDVFWHVVAGRVILEQKLAVARDTFSAIDPDRPWIPLAWGYHVLTYALDRMGGLSALWRFHGVVQIGAFALFYWTCRKRLELRPLTSLTLLALLTVLYADRFRARPHVFNLTFEIILLPWLARGPRLLDRTACVGTAIVVAIWANLHGGGALVFQLLSGAMLAAAIGNHLLRVPGTEGDLRRAGTWFLCAIVPALISPFFVRAVLHTFTMVDATYEYTFEWHPSFRLLLVGTLPAHYIAGAFPSVVPVALAFPLARIGSTWAREGREGLRRALSTYELHRILLVVVLAYVTHRSLRFVYMAAFAIVIEAPLVARAFEGMSVAPRVRSALYAFALVALIAAGYQSRITAIYGSLATAVDTVAHGDPLVPGRFPVAQADLLAQTGFQGTIFCQAAWGGYLLYRLWPNARVLADGRGNHDATVTRDLRTIGNPANMADPANGPVILSIYDRYALDVIVHQNPAWPQGYRVPPSHWVPVQADGTGSIWVSRHGNGERYLERLMQAAGVAPSDGPR